MKYSVLLTFEAEIENGETYRDAADKAADLLLETLHNNGDIRADVTDENGNRKELFASSNVAIYQSHHGREAWKEDDSHGADCAIRVVSSAECTCGKADSLAQ